MTAKKHQPATRPFPERTAAMALNIGSIASGVLMFAVLVWKLAAGQVDGLSGPSTWHILAYLFAGAVAGFCGAILGVGGGFFAVPFLVLVTGLGFQYAAAASIITVVATSCAAAPNNLRHGYANMSLGLVLQLTAIVGAIAGGYLITLLNQVWMSRIFALLLLSGAYFLWRRAHERFESLADGEELGTFGDNYYDPARKEHISYRVRRLPGALGLSAVSGAVTSLGLGGGTVSVPVMRLLCGTPMRVATTTSNYMMGLIAATAALVKYSEGMVLPLVTVPLALGTLGGSRLGALAGHYLRGRWIQYAFVGLMGLVAARMLWGAHGELPDASAVLAVEHQKWYAVFPGLLHGQWGALPAAGLLVLIFTPVVALLVALIAAISQRSWRLAATAAGVLALLAVSLFLTAR